MADISVNISAEEIEAALLFANSIEVGTATLTSSGNGTSASTTVTFQKPHDNPIIHLTLSRGSASYSVVLVVGTVTSTQFSIILRPGALGGLSSSELNVLPAGTWKVNYMITG